MAGNPVPIWLVPNMISVDEALAQAFLLAAKTTLEHVDLAHAGGRVLAAEAVARRDQPPFDASSMDGYAVAGQDVSPGAEFNVVGESAAGLRYSGHVDRGQCVRIFTGAPMPKGTDRVIIQEDVTRTDDRITLNADLDDARYVRPAGADFRSGARFAPGRRLAAADLALLASMNIPSVQAFKRPQIAIIASGDELVMPGEIPGDDQIISSNTFGLAALACAEGAQARVLPIARDNPASIRACFEMAMDADLIVTSGGASVGDHDLIGPVARDMGMEQQFYKVAMRPGKPLMAGKLGRAMVLGLPGNPVSALVCGHVFMRPVLRAMQGLGCAALPRLQAPLTKPIGGNGPREHYMRANIQADGSITPADRQDSALLTVLAGANALLVRPVGDPARQTGDLVQYIPI
jgi:molybdopterin molybdotransferase